MRQLSTWPCTAMSLMYASHSSWCLQVFMFIVNDKGTSWAYTTPGFNSSLNPQVLKQLRTLAEVPESAKIFTEVRVPRSSSCTASQMLYP